MKFIIDALGDTLELAFHQGDDGRKYHSKRVHPKVTLWYTEEGEIAAIRVLALSSLLGGQKLQDLDLDLTPPRENLHIEVDEASLRRVRERLAEYRPGDKSRS